MNIFEHLLDNLIPELIILVLTATGTVLYRYRARVNLWCKRQYLKFFPVNFNLALSIQSKDGLNSGSYFNEIKNQLSRNIDNYGLANQIRLKDFSDINKFNNKSEAERFRLKKNIDLIIWGEFSTDTLKKSGKNYNQLHLNFTYGHPDDKDKKIGRMVLMDISSKFAIKKYWTIVEDESFRDVNIIANNLFDLSLYIIALTLKLYGYIGKSLQIFERLYVSLEKREDAFTKQIVPHLINCYVILIIEIAIKKNRIRTGIDLCNKILSMAKNDFFALANLAVFQYRVGLKNDAIRNVDKLLLLYPKQGITEVDVAFIRILEKNYKSAFRHYKNLNRCKNIDFSPQEVVEFLQSEYSHQKEPAFLFGSAFISTHFGDKQIAKEDFKEFLSKAKNEKYKPMYRYAKKRLGKL